jgi:hypothetical protein
VSVAKSLLSLSQIAAPITPLIRLSPTEVLTHSPVSVLYSEMSYTSSRRHSNRCFISTPPPSPTCLCSSSFGGEEHEEDCGDSLCELTHPSSLPLLCSNRVCRFDIAARSDPTPTPATPSVPTASTSLMTPARSSSSSSPTVG